MNRIPTLSARLVVMGAVAVGTSAVWADFDPIPLTPDSFTHDVIVEKTAAPPLNIYVTASMDGGTNANSWTWFERGYVRNWPGIGLPEAGSSFTAVGDAGRTFQMAGNFATNNALLIYNTGSPTGELLFNTPAAFNTLAVLSSSSGGAATVDYVVHYAGGATQLGQLNIVDWFNTTATEVGVNANGRVNMDNGQIGSLNGIRPNLFYGDIVLTDSATAVTKVTFTATGGNRTAIFAISGHNGMTYVPIAVTGFNRDMIVEKTAPETGFLYNRTTVTMESGAPNNLGNTWYEKGFAPYAPATGLPAAGSTLDVGGTNSFKMPASYTANNILYIANFGGFNVGATLTFDTPAAYTSLSFLSSAGNGPLVANVYVYHLDGSVETPTLTIPDWFNVTPYVYTSAGRFHTENLGLNDVNSTNPRLYAPTIVLTNTTSPVSMLIFGLFRDLPGVFHWAG